MLQLTRLPASAPVLIGSPLACATAHVGTTASEGPFADDPSGMFGAAEKGKRRPPLRIAGHQRKSPDSRGSRQIGSKKEAIDKRFLTKPILDMR